MAKKASKRAGKKPAVKKRTQPQKKIAGHTPTNSLPKDSRSLAAALEAFKSGPVAPEQAVGLFSHARIGSLLKTWDPQVWIVLADFSEQIPSLSPIVEAEASELLDPYARRSFEVAMERRAFVYQDVLPIASPAVLRLLTKALPVMFNVRGLSAETAAKLVAAYEGDIQVEDSEITAPVAESLAKHKGGVTLECIKRLSDTPGHRALLKRILEHRKGRGLDLTSLEEVPESFFDDFSSFDGSLRLGVKKLTDSAVHNLATITGELDLPHLEELSTVQANSLASHPGDLMLNTVRRLSKEAVLTLAQHRGRLGLDHLEEFDDEVAESMAGHDGYVSLDGLSRLHSVALARKLAEGKLVTFRSLTDISDGAIEALFESEGASITFLTLAHLSDPAAAALSRGKCGGVTFLALDKISDSAAQCLAAYKGYLTVTGAALKKVEKYRR